MIDIPGYQILTQIYDSFNSEVYRGIRQSDRTPVIIKILKQDYPTAAELTRYKQEYELTHSLNLEGTIRAYSLQPYQRTLAIVLEDFGGIPLANLLNPSSLNLEQSLEIMIKIAQSLGELHAQNIIHKDINPANIVINPETQQLKLIDLGIATPLSRENPTLKNPNTLEGTLPYISPEQTGRMNRSLDYRTDFYSLGVLFYQLLTHQLPFQTIDPLELVHSHIAKAPQPPHQINPSLPPIFSDIAMKLMAKNAEDRYQSAWGLESDLKTALNQLQQTGTILSFDLGQNDVSDHFSIPQKLYGREREIETLLSSFEGAKDQSEFILVAGYSGIGKSCLVQEIHKPITEKKGYFVSGKFDQFKRNIPYSAILTAFSQFIEQILTESERELQAWKHKFLQALGSNGNVLIDVIPEIELIIGEQPPVAELGATESQNRFNLVFQNFIHATCSCEHPLVVFLDDLQWADAATLKLIKLMMSDVNLQNLLLIGAYRDNEVNPGHPLEMMVNELRETQAIIQEINLNNLSLHHVNQILSETLKSSLEKIYTLAELVFQKTDGNPFFVNHFLLNLYSEKLINFDYEQKKWQWNQQEIESCNITDNVVDLMIQSLKKLPIATQDVLKLAACIGANFDLSTLSIIAQTLPKDTFLALVKAIQSGLILTVSELDQELLIQDYKFLHDRVQQAAYSLIAEDDKAALHLKIGRLLLGNSSEEQKEERLFDFLGHLNLGQALIEQDSEKEELAQLNLQAGEKAKKSTAYSAGILYVETGISLLNPHCWDSQYHLTLKLYITGTELAYLNADLDRMQERANQVLHHGQTILDKIPVYEVLISSYTGQGKMQESVDLGRQVLQELGVDVPASMNATQNNEALQALNQQLEGRTIEELIDLPIMSDRHIQASMNILHMLLAPVFQGKPDLLPMVGITMVRLSLEFGNSPASVVGYVLHGLVLCSVWQELEEGYAFGRLSLNLLDRFHWNNFKSIVLNMFGNHIQHFKDHFRETSATLYEGHKSGLETGDFLFCGYSISNSYLQRFLFGTELEPMIRELLDYRHLMISIKQFSPLGYLDLLQQTGINLRETFPEPHRLLGEVYNEIERIPKHEEDQELTALSLLYLYKLLLAYLFEDYQSALEYIKIAEENNYENAVTGMVCIPCFHFYAALTYLAILSLDSEGDKHSDLERLDVHEKTVNQWAQCSPSNHLHKWYLLQAEKHRVYGNKAEAIADYDRAISAAHENQYIHEEALANELAAKFYLNWGKGKIAQSYMQDASYAYLLWGALAKVNYLNRQYSTLLSAVPQQNLNVTKTITETSSGKNLYKTLDMKTVFKANQIISGEIVLDKLLVELMKIILQNAGAQTGCLMIVDRGSLIIQASGNINSEQIRVLQELPVEESTLVCHAIVNYVARTQESIVLNDASHSGNFTQDSYIQTHQPQSILCVPLVNQGKLISIVCLENNLTTGAFTEERVNIVQVISGQAAIALENAYLYRNLEQKVEERTAELALANAEIKTLNEQLTSENLRLSSELDVAKKIQQMVLPKATELESVEDLEIACYMEPADEVGGDYYDILQEGDRIKISIGDVTGHGLESGVLMLMAQTVVRTLENMQETNAIHFLEMVNKTLCQNLERMNSHKNMSLAILNYKEGLMKVSGQHEEIIVVRGNGELELIDTLDLGFPIGLDWQIGEFIHEQELFLNSDDVIILYTDGITEAENLENQQYGLERLAQLVQQHRQYSAIHIRDRIIEDVRLFIGEQKVFDDITLLVLKQK